LHCSACSTVDDAQLPSVTTATLETEQATHVSTVIGFAGACTLWSVRGCNNMTGSVTPVI
jgi:hypothetical protein